MRSSGVERKLLHVIAPARRIRRFRRRVRSKRGRDYRCRHSVGGL